ncbi:hypothetical protein [Lysobacter sp. GCM10012299]|uniref:hypothetical protein n=1 Tax=Lysobacter sp. GCM10012299 TaxID=3317333 RepID=UPI003619451E
MKTLIRVVFGSVWFAPVVAIATFAISVGTGYLFEWLGIFPPWNFRMTTGNHAVDILGAVFLSPIAETLILAAIIAFAGKWLSRRTSTLLGALLSAAAHAPAWWGWAVSAVIPFVIFSAPFVIRSRWRDAIVFSTLTHAFHNGYCYLALLAGF